MCGDGVDNTTEVNSMIFCLIWF